MARRSNKTAHVLNLLAGHDTQNDSQNDSQNTAKDAAAKDSADISADSPAAAGTSSSPAEDGTAAEPAAATAKESEKPAAAASVTAQNISVIDKTEEDPVADLIQQKLMDEFEKSQQESGNHDTAEANDDTAAEDEAISSAIETISNTEPDSAAAEVADEAIEEAIANSSADIKTAPEEPIEPIAETAASPAPDTDISPVSQTAQPETSSAPIAESTPETAETDPTEETVTAEATAVPDNASEVQQPVSQAAAPEPTPELTPEPEPTPEPEFAYLNIMERIVEDKIIYFMRQFDVCTCDRCKADTIALTMNGLMPKYIVTTPAAVDPLLSYYTNRLISDVTVEATKACMIVKDNPRH